MRSRRPIPAAAFALLAVAATLLPIAGAFAARLRLPPHGDRSVHDLAGVLSPGTVESLERLHKELFEKTGVAIVVITVKSLEDETLSDFAVRIGSEWGVGRKGQDRGIVIAVTTDEPHIYVATGYGVEGFLPDGRVGAILDRDVVSHLRQRDFDKAILNASAGLIAACAEEYGVTIGGIPPSAAMPYERGPLDGLGVAGKLVLLLIILLIVILFRVLILPGLRGGRRRGMWYGGGFGGGFGGGGGGFGGFGGGGFGGGGAGR